VEIEQKDFKITIKTPVMGAPMAVAAMAPVAMQVAAPAPVAAAPVAAPAPAAAPAIESNLIEIKSPMIGTFYRSAGPDKPLFVNIGDEVKSGKVLCIIEAMKLFNEIECEFTGTIVKVLADDGSPVEYDQPLFLIQP
jgi:acetyl-CoA carboxylase biotin carboxyl carrier protein